MGAVGVDQSLFLTIFSWTGRSAWLDLPMKALANDYLVPVTLSLALLWLWFSSPGQEKVQRPILAGVVAQGVVNALIEVINLVYYRPRPFLELNLQPHFYRPLDSSFPSNGTTVAFALATTLLLAHRAGALALIPAALHGFGRVYVGIHYPGDVLAGAALGVLASYGLLRLLPYLEPYPSRLLRLGKRVYLA